MTDKKESQSLEEQQDEMQRLMADSLVNRLEKAQRPNDHNGVDKGTKPKPTKGGEQ